MSAKMILFGGATILSLVFGSVGVSAVLPDEAGQIEPMAWRAARVYGVIESVEEQVVTLATPFGPATLITDVNTLFRARGAEGLDLEDLAVGETVIAVGWWEGEENAFHAFVVLRVASDRELPLVGRLTDVDEGELTLETGRGPAAVRVDEATVYRIPGVEDPGLDDLEPGMGVAVRGSPAGDGTLHASLVGAKGIEPRRGRVRGEVLSIEGDALVVRSAAGRELTVLTDERTEFGVPGVEDASFADVAVGDRIAGEGVSEGDGLEIVRASLIVVLPEAPARVTGTVSAIEGSTVVVRTARGPVDLLTDGATVYRVPGIDDPTLSDVAVGDRVGAVGAWEGESTLRAVAVAVGQDGYGRGGRGDWLPAGDGGRSSGRSGGGQRPGAAFRR